jgi:hypothetical protein
MSAIAMTDDRDVFEELGRLAGPPSLTYAARGTGGKAGSWTAADIAAAMSGKAHQDPERLRNAHAPTQLALAKYAFDPGAVWALQYIWWSEVARMAVDGAWTDLANPEVPRLRALAKATLIEHLCGTRCGVCTGSGLQHNQQPCPACGGLGRQEHSTWWWAQTLHCRHATAAEWAPRIRACMVRLQDWELEAREALEEGRRRGEITLLTPGAD